jgi:hypothetical protein
VVSDKRNVSRWTTNKILLLTPPASYTHKQNGGRSRKFIDYVFSMFFYRLQNCKKEENAQQATGNGENV